MPKSIGVLEVPALKLRDFQFYLIKWHFFCHLQVIFLGVFLIVSSVGNFQETTNGRIIHGMCDNLDSLQMVFFC